MTLIRELVVISLNSFNDFKQENLYRLSRTIHWQIESSLLRFEVG